MRLCTKLPKSVIIIVIVIIIVVTVMSIINIIHISSSSSTGRAVWLLRTCVLFFMTDFVQVQYPLLSGGGTYRSIRRNSERAAASKSASASSGGSGSGSGPPPRSYHGSGYGEVSPHKALHYAHILLPRPSCLLY